MLIGIPAASDNEKRVALVPDTVEKLVKNGHGVIVQPGAGLGAGHTDADYEKVGAVLGDPYEAAIICAVSTPSISSLSSGHALMGLLAPFDLPQDMQDLAAAGVTAFAFEAVPRTTRAQTMDALSSQATVAGYQGTLMAAAECNRFFPMLTTAAGTIRPATVVVLGAGVAGLQAIATARRLGAVVWAFDVRRAAAEQVESLGARFIDTGTPAQDATQAGGYAREVAADEQTRILEGLAPHIAKADAVITTAAIPGRRAPLLVTEAMVETMHRGSVIVDLAASTGGNCELTRPGETVVVDGVSIIGATDMPSRTAAHASQMYSRNMAAFLELLVDDEGNLSPDWDDEIVSESCITRDGRVVHPRLVEDSG